MMTNRLSDPDRPETWTAGQVNRHISYLPLPDQISLALAAVRWAEGNAHPESPVASSLAGAAADLEEALQLLPDPP